MIAGDLLLKVPGCENGEPPYSQELIGGGRVNRSFLVRTRRGRFVVRLNDNTHSDPGLDRDRELALHKAAAESGVAPPVVYAAPDRSSLVTEFIDGRLWTPHYFSRMRDLRALGQRLRALHAVVPPPVPRYDPLVTARRYADTILRHAHEETGRIQMLLANGAEAWSAAAGASGHSAWSTETCTTATCSPPTACTSSTGNMRRSRIPLHDLACVMAYYPRAAAHGGLLLEASGLDATGATPADAGRPHQRLHAGQLPLVPGPPRRAVGSRHGSAGRIRRLASAPDAGARGATSAH